jgi:hypothetical protein
MEVFFLVVLFSCFYFYLFIWLAWTGTVGMGGYGTVWESA